MEFGVTTWLREDKGGHLFLDMLIDGSTFNGYFTVPERYLRPIQVVSE